MKIVTADEMRAIDRASSERYGVPSLTLMENAGTQVADFVLRTYPAAKRIGVISGKGNNGGDGFVVARKLKEAGREVRIILLAEPAELRGDAAEMFGKLPVAPLVIRNSEDWNSDSARSVFGSEVLIDAVLGTGFKPPVRGLYADAIAAMNASSVPVVAVDTPSGADADAMEADAATKVRADAVVTFTAPRPAHIFANLTQGPIVVAPIGSPEEAIVSSLNLYVITPRYVAPYIGARPSDSNKGSFGHVLVIGGSVGKAGAAAMAGFSALRVGAGLSTVATPKSVLPTVAGFHPELMTEPLAETEAGTIALSALEYGRMDQLVEHKTVLALGPGISRQADTAQFVRTVVAKYTAPMVLDADGLNAFEGRAAELRAGELVITPHPGEMARLTGLSVAEIQKARLAVARKFARERGVIVVLKGYRTLVTKPDGEVWVNTTGNPGMATGGTGDILTGMVAGMMAQHRARIFEAVCAAVYLHGLSGDIARESAGEQSMVATDLVRTLPEAMRRVRAAGSMDTTSIAG
ncbi:MAG TPA: NAD(P)H-hydrate dehydratase [Terriglobales bacterium]|nr:NAD(P)H-hydrate dehydratase [Terriglobales bacterium]